MSGPRLHQFNLVCRFRCHQRVRLSLIRCSEISSETSAVDAIRSFSPAPSVQPFPDRPRFLLAGSNRMFAGEIHRFQLLLTNGFVHQYWLDLPAKKAQFYVKPNVFHLALLEGQ